MPTFLAVLGSVSLAFRPTNEVVMLHIKSDQYQDMTGHAPVAMPNAFECTPHSLRWSLFPNELPVKKVYWEVNGTQGLINYEIEGKDRTGDTYTGTVSFNLTEKTGRLNLDTSIGMIRWSLTLDETFTETIRTKEN